MKNIPTIFVVFGATGDLMARKIMPSLIRLFDAGRLPTQFDVIGFSRRDLTQVQFRTFFGDIGTRFSRRFRYHRGNFSNAHDYEALAKRIAEIEDKRGVCGNKIFYLAVPPEEYADIIHHLVAAGLSKPCSETEGWAKVLVEKPFGKDLKTAEALDRLLGRSFKEEQIYRIDHYLAKEMLQNILAFRFSNTLFENIWNNKHVERIDIRLWEKLGVESRGPFYDSVGALRDVGQNHLLQMLALVTMDRPSTLSGDAVRNRRAAILRTLRDAKHVVRAQYEGYRNITGVHPESRVETYFKLTAFLDTPRWRGVPITMEGGKRMPETKKEIVVTFKDPRNTIVFSLEPTESIRITFWSKQPGFDFGIHERTFDFVLRDAGHRVQYIEEYQKMLLDAIAGDQMLFVSTDEVRAMWRFTDPIIEAWAKDRAPLTTYPASPAAGTIGMVGLGKMGGNMAVRLKGKGWTVIGTDKTPDADFVRRLPRPRVVWVMVPAASVDEVLDALAQLLQKNDVIIDGGNSYYEDTRRRARMFRARGISYMDVGVSGGPAGALNGASLMIGGGEADFKKLEPLFAALARPDGYRFFKGTGAGHFVKMVHNGIEYGMMQAIAEGFDILKHAPYRLDLSQVAEVYNNGSVIESRLVGWLVRALATYGADLKTMSSTVGHTGEGAWTVATAKKLGVPARVIEDALKFRNLSAKNPRYAGRVLTALRNQFGEHSVK